MKLTQIIPKFIRTKDNTLLEDSELRGLEQDIKDTGYSGFEGVCVGGGHSRDSGVNI